MENFPLYNRSLQLNSEELYQYIITFYTHDIIFTEKESMLYTYHRFLDGLLIKFTWRIQNPFESIHERKSKDSHSLKKMVEDNLLQLETGIIFYYSDYNSTCSSDTHNSFLSIIQNKERMLSKEEYNNLEYESHMTCNIPDIFFQDIVDKVHNITLFEKYLENKNKFPKDENNS